MLQTVACGYCLWSFRNESYQLCRESHQYVCAAAMPLAASLRNVARSV